MAKKRKSISKKEDEESIEDLLIVLLLAMGIEAKTIAKVLGVVPSAISNKFPVKEIKEQSVFLKYIKEG
jgi:hypothetical protein